MMIALSTAVSRLSNLVVSRSVHPRGVVIAVALAATFAVGCVPFGDPGGPGASGQISLAKDVKTDGLATLRLRAAPDSTDTFDPKAPVFPGAGGEGSAWSGVDAGYDLATITFPFDYETSDALGTTPNGHWRLYACLSAASADPVTEPSSGEPFGTVTFDLDGCGSYGDYCGVKEGVDLTIDHIAP
jgi:hypothetical protein